MILLPTGILISFYGGKTSRNSRLRSTGIFDSKNLSIAPASSTNGLEPTDTAGPET